MLAAYLGGAIATHLTHQQPIFAPALIQAVVWITAVIRFPELTRRFVASTSVGKEEADFTSKLARA